MVGNGTIPILRPGQEAIVEIPWYVPNPLHYTSINSEPWHFCLLAKIISNNDLLTSPMTPNPNEMVRNNNNLGWKNLTIVNTSGIPKIGGVIAVHNPKPTIHNYNLDFVTDDLEIGKPIYEEAEIRITLDDNLLRAWQDGGSEATGIINTKDENVKIITGNNASLKNLKLSASEIGTLNLSYNFLTREITDKKEYKHIVIQKDSETDEIMGGETYEIHKGDREFFESNAGNDINANKNQPVTINAQSITEPAIYNWYDETGNLLYTGKDLTVTQSITKKYKLEVIANDGFKDYSEVEVKILPYKFINMSPNPASNEVLLKYDIENCSSAYFTITGLTNNISNNYILNNNSSQKVVNLANYQSGQYVVTLIVDGNVIESKNLIKN